MEEVFINSSNSDNKIIKRRAKKKKLCRQKKHHDTNREEKIELLRESLKDPEYIANAIDIIADRMATAWIAEKYHMKKESL